MLNREKVLEIISELKLEEYQKPAVPYIIGIFLFVFSIIGLVSLSYLLF